MCIQVSLHYPKAASSIFSRSFTKEDLDVALIQGPWKNALAIHVLRSKEGKLVYNTQHAAYGTQSFPLSEFILGDLLVV